MLVLITSLAISLILTILIELITSRIQKIKGIKNYIIIILINICTNPIVVYIANITLILKKELYNVVVAVLEIIVVIVETYFLKKYLNSDINKFKLSFVNNVISFGTGIIITFLIY